MGNANGVIGDCVQQQLFQTYTAQPEQIWLLTGTERQQFCCRSVPSGRVGNAKDAIFRSNDHFRQAVAEREDCDVAELQHRLDRSLEKAERARIGVGQLRRFLEQLLQRRYPSLRITTIHLDDILSAAVYTCSTATDTVHSQYVWSMVTITCICTSFGRSRAAMP